MDDLIPYEQAQDEFKAWEKQLNKAILEDNSCLMHTYHYYFSKDAAFLQQLQHFAKTVANDLEPAVMENNIDSNLPSLQHYNAIGERNDRVLHHPSYIKAGDIIYGSGLMAHLLKPGQMKKTLGLFLLASHAGEAGHNCPIACSAGLIRVLKHHSQLKETDDYLEKLTRPSFRENFTAAQFLTEIQGGSDVGANASHAIQDEQQQWRISGEKWFCSNANAELILMTARFNQSIEGTKGLGLFLVPAQIADGQPNHYKIRRLKQKIGTRSMATAEIGFEGALAYPMGPVEEGIHLVMENVLHLSRLFNAFSVLGMARRAYQIAYYYALNRSSFEHKIITYPLVKETLAEIKSENLAMLASVFHVVQLQDEMDCLAAKKQNKEKKLLLRTLANLNKYFTAKRSVENIHHCIDILAGNGTIETFSSLPRLLRDCLVCENWEGTHFVLWMQTLRDINKFQVDEVFLSHLTALFDKISETNENKSLFKDKINELSDKLKALKTSDHQQQTLMIRDIVECMAVLLSAVCLTLETETRHPSAAKKAAVSLFISKYWHKDKQINTIYFETLDTVLQISD